MADQAIEHIRELAPFKIEFIDGDNNYHKLDSYIKAIDDNYILISPPAKNGVYYSVEDNTEINMIFQLANGVFIAQCTVLNKVLTPNSGIKITHPSKTKTLERREYIRVPIKTKIEVICYADQFYMENNAFFGVTKNLSGSGVSFYHKEPIKDYYDIVCKIYLEDGDPNPVETHNDLVHTEKVKIKNEDHYLSALTFTSISQSDSTRIIKECFKYQVKHKKIGDY